VGEIFCRSAVPEVMDGAESPGLVATSIIAGFALPLLMDGVFDM
jgi:hypothetical protein